jgi:hypothetical protein
MRKKAYLSIGATAVAATLAVGSAVSLAGGSSVTAQPTPPTRPGAGAPSIAIPLRANLSASQVSSLQVASTATGRFIGALGRGGGVSRTQRPNLSWSLFWVIAVKNTTGPVTGIEIRRGETNDVRGAVASGTFLTLCGPCRTANAAAGSPTDSLLGGSVRNLTREQVSALRQGDLYVNVMTAANPAGELRGQITRRSPVTPTNAPPVNRMPNPLKPVPNSSP